MEKWRRVWREGIVPLLPHAALLSLREALINDDPRLLQGVTCAPPLLDLDRDLEVEGACAITWCGWQAENLRQVGPLEEYFGRLCAAIDRALEEPAASRYFLNWYDETPRDQMRRELLAEVERALPCASANAA